MVIVSDAGDFDPEDYDEDYLDENSIEVDEGAVKVNSTASLFTEQSERRGVDDDLERREEEEEDNSGDSGEEKKGIEQDAGSGEPPSDRPLLVPAGSTPLSAGLDSLVTQEKTDSNPSERCDGEKCLETEKKCQGVEEQDRLDEKSEEERLQEAEHVIASSPHNVDQDSGRSQEDFFDLYIYPFMSPKEWAITAVSVTGLFILAILLSCVLGGVWVFIPACKSRNGDSESITSSTREYHPATALREQQDIPSMYNTSSHGNLCVCNMCAPAPPMQYPPQTSFMPLPPPIFENNYRRRDYRGETGALLPFHPSLSYAQQDSFLSATTV